MHFPKSLHAEGWHAHLPHLRLFHSHDDARSPRSRRGLHIAATAIALTALTASVGLAAVQDPRPLDVQLAHVMHRAGETLQQWQAQLSHGLQVSLRAVADGRDTPGRPVGAMVVAKANTAAAAASALAPR